MEMGWRWDFTIEILPQMAIATLNTILAAGVGYAIALVVGLFFLLGQRTPFRIINWGYLGRTGPATAAGQPAADIDYSWPKKHYFWLFLIAEIP